MSAMPADDSSAAGLPSFPVPVYRTGWLFAGRFALRRCIGRGGMGVVWLAEDQLLEQEVAVKFLPEWLLWDADGMNQLRTEARVLQKLSHPGIVRLHDLHQADGVAALVFEYVDGGNLQEWRLHTPSLEERLHQLEEWLPALSEALVLAHSLGVIHRDLKPSNFLITKNGAIKITDFGLAEPLALSITRNSRFTGAGGTIAYMSPQQLLGEPPQPADDVYALGATCYDLIAGHPPFYRGSVETQILQVPAPSLGAQLDPAWKSTHPDLWPAWQEWLGQCLQKSVHHRPDSVHQALASWNALRHSNRRSPESRLVRPRILVMGGLFLALCGSLWYAGLSTKPPLPLPGQPAPAQNTTNPVEPLPLPPETRMIVGYQSDGIVLHLPLDGNLLDRGITATVSVSEGVQACADRFGRAAAAYASPGMPGRSSPLGRTFNRRRRGLCPSRSGCKFRSPGTKAPSS